VLTIEDPGTRFGLRFHRPPHPQHLVLNFVDLDRRVPPPHDERPGFRLASVEQVADGLTFARGCENLLVHCQVGIARAPAMALGVLMDRLGDEEAAFLELQRLRPEAVPNRHVVRLIDHILNSKLSARLDDWDARNGWSKLRRLLCRRNYFLDGGIPLEPEMTALSFSERYGWIRKTGSA
jgi:predicted protein tyrosine phosphatase